MASKQELSALAKGVVGLGVDADLLGLERVRDALDLAFLEVRRVYQATYPVKDDLEEGLVSRVGGSPGDAR